MWAWKISLCVFYDVKYVTFALMKRTFIDKVLTNTG